MRLGVLQGLLDSDGGPVRQRGRSCRIQYTTCSDRLRDDVVWLVRSLGGVACSDAHVVDIRLPGQLSGWDIAERARAMRPDLPVIYATGYSGELRIVPGGEFLRKPYSIDGILGVLGNEAQRGARR